MRNDGSRGRGTLTRLPQRCRWPLEEAWHDRAWREFKLRNLTRCYRDVLLALPGFQGPDGDLYPSHAAIAKRIGCNERTVRRALAMAAKLGLVAVLPRRARTKSRWVRTSNRYLLNVPEGQPKPGLRPVWPKSSTGQFGRVQDSVSKKEAFEGMVREAAGLPDLLAARRQSFLVAQQTACQ